MQAKKWKQDRYDIKAYHDTSTNSVGMDRLGWEHEMLVFTEVRIDVTDLIKLD
jgi:hypothetical protein